MFIWSSTLFFSFGLCSDSQLDPLITEKADGMGRELSKLNSKYILVVYTTQQSEPNNTFLKLQFAFLHLHN